ncbi:hypothetical protein [Halobellus sp. H-GB7]|uniref:hypothetical protein n=1 Tax=Halobellus sp. H-GB7 TaxID=3069756 RepID=UPI0027B3B69D|nr:hypothetical protein [Halobellus sp. H-GB7]MDQ2055963.1 hypothetical protein [Halobellus sp. H-GB7]
MQTEYAEQKERTDHERITDIRDVNVGDEILVGDRVKPIVVDDRGTRPVKTFQGERTQHAVEASGEWADAVSVLLVNRIDMATGERRGEVSVDLGAPEPVWRVSE